EAALSLWNDLDLAICSEALPDLIAQLSKGPIVRPVEQTFENVEARFVVDRDHPLGRFFARSVAAIRQRNPERIRTAVRPNDPAVVLLDRFRELKPGSPQRRELFNSQAAKSSPKQQGLMKCGLTCRCSNRSVVSLISSCTDKSRYCSSTSRPRSWVHFTF